MKKDEQKYYSFLFENYMAFCSVPNFLVNESNYLEMMFTINLILNNTTNTILNAIMSTIVMHMSLHASNNIGQSCFVVGTSLPFSHKIFSLAFICLLRACL